VSKVTEDYLKEVAAELTARLNLSIAAAHPTMLSREFSPGKVSYSYFAAGKRRPSPAAEDRTRFCVSSHRNRAGVYLLWREVVRYKLVSGRWRRKSCRRTEFQYGDSKKELLLIAKRKAERLSGS
jgi:hypothetical protein